MFVSCVFARQYDGASVKHGKKEVLRTVCTVFELKALTEEKCRSANKPFNVNKSMKQLETKHGFLADRDVDFLKKKG
jgi:hypothetical protein